jgi:hypothetical protein
MGRTMRWCHKPRSEKLPTYVELAMFGVGPPLPMKAHDGWRAEEPGGGMRGGAMNWRCSITISIERP